MIAELILGDDLGSVETDECGAAGFVASVRAIDRTVAHVAPCDGHLATGVANSSGATRLFLIEASVAIIYAVANPKGLDDNLLLRAKEPFHARFEAFGVAELELRRRLFGVHRRATARAETVPLTRSETDLKGTVTERRTAIVTIHKQLARLFHAARRLPRATGARRPSATPARSAAMRRCSSSRVGGTGPMR